MYFGFWAPPRFSNVAYVLKLKSASVIIFFFSQTINQKNLIMFWAFILDPHFGQSGLQLLSSSEKSLKEREERKQEEDGFGNRGRVQLP